MAPGPATGMAAVAPAPATVMVTWHPKPLKASSCNVRRKRVAKNRVMHVRH